VLTCDYLSVIEHAGKDSVNLGNENMVSASTLAETIHSPDDIPYSEEDGNRNNNVTVIL